MTKAKEEIIKLSLDERAFIAFDIQNSFYSYDAEFTNEEKILLDEMSEKIKNNLVKVNSLDEVLVNLDKKYAV